MRINVKFTPSMVAADSELRNATVVVIDTLRATSTIISALMAGAREVVMAATIEEAVGISQRLGTERTLLGGERGGMRINGFTFGNSPAEYTPELVHGKTIVMTTSNGSSAVLKARQAARLYCGALLNASVLAQRLVEESPDELLLLCAGGDNNFSLEDCIAAGAVIAHVVASAGSGSVELRDGARMALVAFFDVRNDIPAALRSTDHGRSLIELGLGADVEFAAQMNLPDAQVPELVGSSIKVVPRQPAPVTQGS